MIPFFSKMRFELEFISKNKMRYKYVHHYNYARLKNKVEIYSPNEFSSNFINRLHEELSNTPGIEGMQFRETDGWVYVVS